jgi:S1-C subfamily serine protease
VVVAARGANAPYSGRGLETGDVIFEINGAPTVTLKDLRAKLDVLKAGDAVVLQVQRHDKLVYVTLELE